MIPERSAAAFFVTAFLSRLDNLSHRQRSLAALHSQPFDIRSYEESTRAVADACLRAGLPVPSNLSRRNRLIGEAADKTEQWIAAGISVVESSLLPLSASMANHLPPVLFASGNRDVLERPIAAVLNSRKPRKTSPSDGWIANTVDLVRFATDSGLTVASSFGTLPYCVVSFAARGSPCVIVCDDVLPFMDSPLHRENFTARFGDLFDRRTTLFISSFPPGKLPPQSARSVERDRMVVSLSALLLVAEVRPGGNMEALLRDAAARSATMPAMRDGHPANAIAGNQCQQALRKVTWNEAIARNSPVRTRVSNEGSDESRTGSRFGQCGKIGSSNRSVTVSAVGAHRQRSSPSRSRMLDSPFLVHYTRSCDGPWPGQSIAQYCRSLVEGHENAAHTAFDTLRRILGEGLIRGSSALTRGPGRIVSFTECLPDELHRLITWQRGLIRWSFEPYGVAVPKDVLFDLGARPAIYGTEEVYGSLGENDKYRFQLVKPMGRDWTKEKEWRLVGDLSLRDVPRHRIVPVVSHPDEARIIRDELDYPDVWVTSP